MKQHYIVSSNIEDYGEDPNLQRSSLETELDDLSKQEWEVITFQYLRGVYIVLLTKDC